MLGIALTTPLANCYLEYCDRISCAWLDIPSVIVVTQKLLQLLPMHLCLSFCDCIFAVAGHRQHRGPPSTRQKTPPVQYRWPVQKCFSVTLSLLPAAVSASHLERERIGQPVPFRYDDEFSVIQVEWRQIHCAVCNTELPAAEI